MSQNKTHVKTTSGKLLLFFSDIAIFLAINYFSPLRRWLSIILDDDLETFPCGWGHKQTSIPSLQGPVTNQSTVPSKKPTLGNDRVD